MLEAADRIDELETEYRRLKEAYEELSAHAYEEADVIREQKAEIDRLRKQAAEDIAWMSGIGPIPDEAFDHWRRIQDRWLVDQYEIPPPVLHTGSMTRVYVTALTVAAAAANRAAGGLGTIRRLLWHLEDRLTDRRNQL